MNKVILIGRVTKDIEERSSNDKSFARFILAVDRRYTKDKDQQADFINCVAFGKTAEFLAKYGKKGTKFAAEGRIQTGSYDKDGQKVYTTDVVVENVEFAESKNSNGGGNSNPTSDAPKQSAQSEDFMAIPETIESELPFA